MPEKPLPSDTSPTPVLAEGVEFAGYRVIRLLGRGGMGEVYEVEHLHLGERYALKVLNAEIAAQEGARERFLTEAKVMAKLEHRNLVKVGDCRETEGKLWLRMELASGLEMSDHRRMVSLADLLDAYEGRPMKPELVRNVLEGVLCGLGSAHAANLVHRDLKPGNILLWPDGTPKISDFGLVRVVNQEFRASRIRFVAESVLAMGMTPAGSATRALLGSYEFMSPEQKRGEEAGTRSDLYAVGLMAFRMLTGHESPGMESASRLVQGLDPKWDAWLVWLLKPDPRMRCPSARDALAGLPGTGTVKPPPPDKPAKRKRTFLAGASVIGVAAALGLVALAIINKDKPPGARDGDTVRPKGQEEKSERGAANLGDRAKVTPATATKDQHFVNSLGMEFVPVPITGGPTDGKPILFSIWETRVADFRAFVEATGYDAVSEGPNGIAALTLKRFVQWGNDGGSWLDPQFPPGHEQNAINPVVCVSCLDAEEFCRWLTKRDRSVLPVGSSYRLPTDEEWSSACGPTEFPWGNDWPPGLAAGNYFGPETSETLEGPLAYEHTNELIKAGRSSDGCARTAPVGSFTPNERGLYDMGGNVSEWCATWYKSSLNTPKILDVCPKLKDDKGGQAYRLLRGASWSSGERVEMLSDYHTGSDPRSRWDYRGFRCVLEMKSGGMAQNQAEQPPPQALPVSDDPAVTVSPAVATQQVPFENKLKMKFAPVTITDGPTSGKKVLFSVWETRVRDFQDFVDATGHDAIRDGPSGVPACTLERKDGAAAWKQAGGSWKDPRFPPGDGQNELHPVVCVSYLDAEVFCAWLTKADASLLPRGWHYRLPTDAEWSSASGPDEYPWGGSYPPSGMDGNYCGTEAMIGPLESYGEPVKAGRSDQWPRTAPVGSCTPNRLGLFDMGGNVWEWCATWYQTTLNTAETLEADSSLKEDGGSKTARVVRGGSWNYIGRVNLRSTCRNCGGPRSRFSNFGFRVVLVGDGG